MKNLKKAICTLLILAISLSICSCTDLFGVNTDNYAVALASNKKDVGNNYRTPEYLIFEEKLSDFSARLSEQLCLKFSTDNENLCFSPISVYMALALAVECSGGETRAQLLRALNMSYDEVRQFTEVIYSVCNKEYYYNQVLTEKKKISAFSELNNSIWLDDSVMIDRDSANALAKNYNADIFGVNFKNGEADKVIKQYINDKSRGLLDGDVRMLPETVFVLLNTLYLKEIWNDMGRELKKTDAIYEFENTTGNTENTYLLESDYSAGKAYAKENYLSFFARTQHGYQLHFILPNEGVSAKDAFTENNISEILAITDYGSVDDEHRQIHYTRVLFPEFDAEFDRDINSVLEENFGIIDMFSEDDADFSALHYDYPYNLYCDKVVHKTAITVDAKGIEGAAFTAVVGAGDSGPPPYEKVYHDFIIDRAFGFILTDRDGTVLFSGVVNEID